jgi:CheY-like chemotaxis protein
VIINKPKILIVDDETFNLDILETDLTREGYEVFRAEDGVAALAKLKDVPDMDVIILDRMMPNMDGMQVTRELKGNPAYRDIPIIMQTAAAQTHQVKEGLQAGVYYYLIKPYEIEVLRSVVQNALAETTLRQEARKYASSQPRMQGVMKHGSFEFRTLKEVRSLAHYVASCCPKPDMVVYGLNELMVNAVEHGNLNISYIEKLELVNANNWQKEVERRLELEENKDKTATLVFDDDGEYITIAIKDKGRGFDWLAYIDFDPMRMRSDPNGKGIAITRVTCFPDLEYKGDGSEVICKIRH